MHPARPGRSPVAKAARQFTSSGRTGPATGLRRRPTRSCSSSVAPAGTVTIASGATYATTNVVTIATTATDAVSGLSQVALSNDGTIVDDAAVRSVAGLDSCRPANGTRTVHVKWQDAAGNWSAVKSDTIVLDTVAPTATAPRRGLRGRRRPSMPGRITLRVPWSGTGRHERDRPLRARSRAPTAARGRSSRRRSPARPPTARWRACTPIASGCAPWTRPATSVPWVFGHDRSGMSRYSEFNSAITYTGSWTTVSGPAPTGAARPSARARPGRGRSLTFTGRSVAWIARTGPNRGVADGLRQRHQGRHGRPVFPDLRQPAGRVGAQLVDLGGPHGHHPGGRHQRPPADRCRRLRHGELEAE